MPTATGTGATEPRAGRARRCPDRRLQRPIQSGQEGTDQPVRRLSTIAASPITTKGDYDHAIADYDAAIKLKPRRNAYVRAGLSYFHKNQYDHAYGDFSQAIRLSPRTPDAYYQRATAGAALSKYDEPVADLNRAIALKRNLPKPISTGAASLCARVFAGAVAISTSSSGCARASGRIQRPWVSRNALGDFDKAVTDFGRGACSSIPSSPRPISGGAGPLRQASTRPSLGGP
jgi:hypothetical protein